MERPPPSHPSLPHHGHRQPPSKSPHSETSSPAPAVAAATTVAGGRPPATSVPDAGAGPPPSKRSRTSVSTTSSRAGVPRVSYPKRRVNVACEVCRSRKTRCDAARPSCSFCTDIGAQCIYRRPEETSRPEGDSPEPQSNALVESTLDGHEVIAHLARIEGLLQQAVPQSNGYSPGSPSLRVPSESEHQNHLPSPQSSHDSYSIIHAPYSMGTPKFTFGFDLSGLARLSELPVPKELLPLCADAGDLERQLQQELCQDRELFRAGYTPLDTLDLGPARCAQLRESFLRDVLPWCPIIHQRECTEIVERTVVGGFDPFSLDTAMTLFVLAGGAFAAESRHLADEASGFPGLAYFRAACQIVDLDRVNSHSIRYVQCHILMAVYLLYCLRPVHAYEAIQKAALRVTFLLQLESQICASPAYHKYCLRAYWTCYLIEHELQVFIPWSSQLLQDLNENMDFPSSDDGDEPGMYWFLAEITMRRIFSRPRHGMSWNQLYSIYEPVVAEEISAQVTKWHASLPPVLRFSLDETVPPPPLPPLQPQEASLEPQKNFLRAQYYAIQTTLFWPYVVRMLSLPPGDTLTSRGGSPAQGQVQQLAAKSLRFAVVHMWAVGPLLSHRHLMLLADQTGTYTITMLLLCAYGASALREIQHAGMAEAIVMGWRFLKTWEMNPGLRMRVEKVERLMRVKGIVGRF